MRGNGEEIMRMEPVLPFGMTIKNAFDEEAVVTKHFANSVNKPVGGLWLSPIAEGKSEWVKDSRCFKKITEKGRQLSEIA